MRIRPTPVTVILYHQCWHEIYWNAPCDMFSSCEDPDEEKPSERNISKKSKYFPVSFYCILTWRKSSQSHWKARDIMFSLIVNLDFDRIQKKSHITSKQAFEKLRVPTHGQSKLNWPCTQRVLCLRCREESHSVSSVSKVLTIITTTFAIHQLSSMQNKSLIAQKILFLSLCNWVE